MCRWLLRLVDAEVRRLTRERDQARAERDQAAKAAVRHRVDALVQQARADALAEAREKESNT
ncbi:hypothetical protein ACWD6N_03640 [Micromonospora sp. NPDC005163]